MSTKNIYNNYINIIDAMILIACAPICIFLIKYNLILIISSYNNYLNSVNLYKKMLNFIDLTMFILVPIVVAMSIAITIIGLLQCNSREGLRQPGILATSLASIALLINGAIRYHWSIDVYFYIIAHELIGIIVPNISLTVVGGWITLYVMRSWEKEPSFPDRAGRSLGWAWIGFLVMHAFRLYIAINLI